MPSRVGPAPGLGFAGGRGMPLGPRVVLAGLFLLAGLGPAAAQAAGPPVTRLARAAPAQVAGPAPARVARVAPAPELAIVGARIYPSPTADPIPEGAVLIRDGKIAAIGARAGVDVPDGVAVLEATDLVLTAGFWNSHVHFGQRKWEDAAEIPGPVLARQLRDMLTRYGFTHVFDTGSPWANTRAIRERVEAGEVDGPAILSTGEIVWPKGGVPSGDLIAALGLLLMETPEVATAAEGSEVARTLIGQGVDAVKIYAETWAGPKVALPPGVVKAIVEEAHASGKLAFAHPSDRRGLAAAVEGGVDVIVHTAPEAGPWDPDLIARMTRSGTALIPTLKLWEYETRNARSDWADAFVTAGVEQLRAYAAAGGTILFGTDVGYMADYDPAREYELMALAGMDFRRILAALTTAPAERFGLSGSSGTIAPGMDADLVLLAADPAADATAFARVRYTLRGGQIVYDSE